MITPTIKIKKEVGNSARSANRIGRSSVKSERRTAKKVFGNNGAISAYGPARSTIKGTPLKPDELEKIDAYWQASLYLCLGMLYLKDNPLLREPLKAGVHLHPFQSPDQQYAIGQSHLCRWWRDLAGSLGWKIKLEDSAGLVAATALRRRNESSGCMRRVDCRERNFAGVRESGSLTCSDGWGRNGAGSSRQGRSEESAL